MRQLEVQALAGFNETIIDEPVCFDVSLADGRVLTYSDVLSSVPAVTSSYDGTTPSYGDRYPNQLPLMAEVGLETWDPDINYPAHRFAEFHGRNLEVMAGRVAISDQNGNAYRSLCIKGSDLSDPYFMESITASRKFIINGLQESLVIERVIRSSKLLRQHHIPTEYICGLVLPDYFPVGDAYTNIDSGKTMELPDFLEKLASDYAAEEEERLNEQSQTIRADTKIQIRETPLEIKTDMIERFSDCDYLITFRAMDTPFRLAELADEDRFEEFKQHLLQQDPNNALLEEYLKDYTVWSHINSLSSQLGVDLARMHKIGLTHGFLSTTNITALGSIVDLDSCKGEALGLNDEPRTTDDELNDVIWVFRSISDVIKDAAQPYVKTPQEGYNLNSYDYFITLFFLQDYMNNRYDKLEDKISFINGFVKYELDDVTHDEDFMTHRKHEMAADLAHCLLPESFFKNPIKIPTVRGNALLNRSNVNLKNVPVSLLEELQDKLLQKKWSTNKYHPDIDPEAPIINPISGRLESVVLAQMVKDYTDDETCGEEDLLRFMVCFMAYQKDFQKNAFPSESIEAVSQYSVQVKQNLFACLREQAIQRITPQLREHLLSLKLDGRDSTSLIENLAGTIGKHEFTDGNKHADIIYTQPGDHERLLELLRAKTDTKFKSVSAIQMIKEIGDVIDNPDGQVMLIDNKVAIYIAEAIDPIKGLLYLFPVDKEFKIQPTILISGILSNQPQFYIVDNPDDKAVQGEEESDNETDNDQEGSTDSNYNSTTRAIDEFPVQYSLSETLRLLKEGRSASKYAPLTLDVDGDAAI